MTKSHKAPALRSFILEENVSRKIADQDGLISSPEAKSAAREVQPVKQLLKSHSAQRLMSPVRMCQYTRVRLPSAFLIPLTLVHHPVLPESWILPDFSRTGTGQRRYVLNSRTVLELMGKGAWKRLTFHGTQPVVFERDLINMSRKRVWRSDMIQYVEKDMIRFAPGMTLGP